MSVAQFVTVGGNPAAMTIESFAQNSGEWMDSFLVKYNDNIESISENFYFLSADMIKNYDLPADVYKPGWYFADGEGLPDLDRGIQKAELPYTQGCLIYGAAGAGVALTSAGEVENDNYEIVIASGARHMTGNPLPRKIDINELEQVGGDWMDSFLVTYNDNVESTSENLFCLTAEMIVNYDLPADVYKPGWYFADGEGLPDLDRGIQKITFDAGQGFVIYGAAAAGVTIRFPKAVPDAE